MTPRGRADFARVTGNNVNRNLAIVLDSEISSAPVINERIPGGKASITGSFNVEGAKESYRGRCADFFANVGKN